MQSIYANMEYLYLRVVDHIEYAQIAWLLWYIWKRCSDFNGIGRDPRDVLSLAETEPILWKEAQIQPQQNGSQGQSTNARREENPNISQLIGRWCFTDLSWTKGKDLFSGNCWYSILEGFDGFMGAINTHCSHSPLHAEVEALMWAM